MTMAINNLALCRTSRTFCLAALSCLLFLSLPALAQPVEARLPSGIVATANYHTGLAARPAVLMLHGFLQTWHSPPMSSLASNLASRGYTVLSPTMSLNINRRNQSMACDAVHTHTMEGEVAEVTFWVNWLNNKGFKDIALIGFSSTGNIAALLYSTRKPNPAIKQVILTSLNPLFADASERQSLLGTTGTMRPKHSKELEHVSLGYCKKNFTATLNSYRSYAVYDNSNILEIIRNTRVPTEIILGSADTIIPANWPAQINALNSHNTLTTIENANHFFDDTSEFDLAETVENILKNISSKNP